MVNQPGYVAPYWNYTIRLKDDPGNTTTIYVPEQSEAHFGTTYMYYDPRIPQKALEAPDGVGCGSRCIWMWAHKSPELGDPNPNNSEFFRCPISLSPVYNSNQAAHDVPDGVARVIVASIGLQGRMRTPGADGSWQQVQLFPFNSPWDVHGERFGPQEVGANMAEFAILSLAKWAQQNPRIDIMGTLPRLGGHLTIQWGLLAGLLACVAAVHGVLLAGIFYVVYMQGWPHARSGVDSTPVDSISLAPQGLLAEGLVGGNGHSRSPSPAFTEILQ